MVEEALSNVAPNISVPSKPNHLKQAAEKSQAAAKKNAATRSTAKPVDRKVRLQIHLWIGFLMVGVAVLGYTFLGPGVKASAAGAANHQLVNVSTPGGIPDPRTGQMQFSDIYASVSTSELSALQTEMAEITRQMNTLKPGAYTANTPQVSGGAHFHSATSTPPGSAYSHSNSGNRSDQVQATLEQMMAITHDMMAKMDSMKQYASGSGTGGHH